MQTVFAYSRLTKFIDLDFFEKLSFFFNFGLSPRDNNHT